jgi:hypothetical protein
MVIDIVLLLIPQIKANVWNVNRDISSLVTPFANSVNVGKDNSIMEIFLILVAVLFAI